MGLSITRNTFKKENRLRLNGSGFYHVDDYFFVNGKII